MVESVLSISLVLAFLAVGGITLTLAAIGLGRVSV